MQNYPDDAPTQYRQSPQSGLPPQPGGSPPPQEATPPPAQPGMYPPAQSDGQSVQPGSYPPPPQSGFPGAQQSGYQPPQQTNYGPAQPGAYPPYQQGYPGASGVHSPPLTPQQTQAMPSAPPGGPLQAPGYPYQPPAPLAGQPGMAAGMPGTRTAFSFQKFWRDLALLGQVTGIAGALLLIFFFLPWLSTPDFNAGTLGNARTIPTISHSGWNTANGLALFDRTTTLNLFPHLWLVLVSALALIALACLLGFGRIRVRPASIWIAAISLFALLLEFFFLIQVSSLENAVTTSQVGGSLNQSLYGVSWGFWLAVVATIAALGIGLYLLLQAYGFIKRQMPPAPGMPGAPGQWPSPTG